MKGISPLAAAVVGLALSWGAPSSLAQGTADSTQPTASSDMSQRMLQLEKEVTDLRSELAALKQKGTEGATSQSSAQPAVQNNFVASGTSATSSQPATPTPSLSSLLGPTSFSGFVDLYYGQNFNNPASRTNTLRAFDVNSNQFGLNLVELVVDKQPDPNNSRTGYHIALGYGHDQRD
jgi:hypothetical protein